MRSKSLKTRYVLTVLVVGILLTRVRRARRCICEAPDARHRASDSRGPLLAAGISRGARSPESIDAMVAMITERRPNRPQARHTEPLPRSGVREMRALEGRSREDARGSSRARRSRATTSKRSSTAWATRCSWPPGRPHPVRPMPLRSGCSDARPTIEGLDFDTLIAPEHLAAFGVEKVLEAPGRRWCARPGTDHTGGGECLPISSADHWLPGSHLRAARYHRPQARRAAHPLPRTLRRAHQDPEPHAVSAPAAAGDRALGASAARAACCCTSIIDNFKDINDTFGHEAGDRIARNA